MTKALENAHKHRQQSLDETLNIALSLRGETRELGRWYRHASHEDDDSPRSETDRMQSVCYTVSDVLKGRSIIYKLVPPLGSTEKTKYVNYDMLHQDYQRCERLHKGVRVKLTSDNYTKSGKTLPSGCIGTVHETPRKPTCESVKVELRSEDRDSQPSIARVPRVDLELVESCDDRTTQEHPWVGRKGICKPKLLGKRLRRYQSTPVEIYKVLGCNVHARFLRSPTRTIRLRQKDTVSEHAFDSMFSHCPEADGETADEAGTHSNSIIRSNCVEDTNTRSRVQTPVGLCQTASDHDAKALDGRDMHELVTMEQMPTEPCIPPDYAGEQYLGIPAAQSMNQNISEYKDKKNLNSGPSESRFVDKTLNTTAAKRELATTKEELTTKRQRMSFKRISDHADHQLNLLRHELTQRLQTMHKIIQESVIRALSTAQCVGKETRELGQWYRQKSQRPTDQPDSESTYEAARCFTVEDVLKGRSVIYKLVPRPGTDEPIKYVDHGTLRRDYEKHERLRSGVSVKLTNDYLAKGIKLLDRESIGTVTETPTKPTSTSVKVSFDNEDQISKQITAPVPRMILIPVEQHEALTAQRHPWIGRVCVCKPGVLGRRYKKYWSAPVEIYKGKGRAVCIRIIECPSITVRIQINDVSEDSFNSKFSHPPEAKDERKVSCGIGKHVYKVIAKTNFTGGLNPKSKCLGVVIPPMRLFDCGAVQEFNDMIRVECGRTRNDPMRGFVTIQHGRKLMCSKIS